MQGKLTKNSVVKYTVQLICVFSPRIWEILTQLRLKKNVLYLGFSEPFHSLSSLLLKIKFIYNRDSVSLAYNQIANPSQDALSSI